MHYTYIHLDVYIHVDVTHTHTHTHIWTGSVTCLSYLLFGHTHAWRYVISLYHRLSHTWTHKYHDFSHTWTHNYHDFSHTWTHNHHHFSHTWTHNYHHFSHIWTHNATATASLSSLSTRAVQSPRFGTPVVPWRETIALRPWLSHGETTLFSLRINIRTLSTRAWLSQFTRRKKSFWPLWPSFIPSSRNLRYVCSCLCELCVWSHYILVCVCIYIYIHTHTYIHVYTSKSFKQTAGIYCTYILIIYD